MVSPLTLSDAVHMLTSFSPTDSSSFLLHPQPLQPLNLLPALLQSLSFMILSLMVSHLQSIPSIPDIHSKIESRIGNLNKMSLRWKWPNDSVVSVKSCASGRKD